MEHAHHRTVSADQLKLDGQGLGRLTKVFGAVGIGGLLLTFLLATRGEEAREQFFFSYLTSFVFWLSLALGALIFVLIQYATRAGWSVVVRRLAEHTMATLPLFAVLFVPIAFGLHDLFHWSHADLVAEDPLLMKKSGYLNASFFYFRAVLYFAVWSGLALWFRRRSLIQDLSKDPLTTRLLQSVSAPGIVLFGVTMTFASFDWLMSLDPHWYSTAFGVYFFAGCFLAIHAVLILLSLGLQSRRILPGVVTFEHFHDLGKMLFAFVVFWAYIGFSQFMLIWYANIPEETLWYQERLQHGWYAVTVALAVGHFALPFFFLLLRDVKRRRGTLRLAALWLLAVHFLDIYWIVMPTLHQHGVKLSPMDLTAFLGIGGLFCAALGVLMRRGALVPIGDPRLVESLSFENA
ncbi:MAG: quinol:cytochrome C oxidoreductase [Acidobacteria bacterium]|nr:quinol:cytochrome C oxidoreductase [Acidobacteriota bacterium]